MFSWVRILMKSLSLFTRVTQNKDARCVCLVGGHFQSRSSLFSMAIPLFFVWRRMRFLIWGWSVGLKIKIKAPPPPKKKAPKMRRSLELGGPLPQHHCRGAWKQQDVVTKSTRRQWRSRQTRLMWWLGLKLAFSVKRCHRSVCAKTMFIFQIKGENMFHYVITFLITEFILFLFF